MSISTGRMQPSSGPGIAAWSGMTSPTWRRSALAALVLSCVAIGLVFHFTPGRASVPVIPSASTHPAARMGLASLPLAAQGTVSAALGRDDPAYRIRGSVAQNPAQQLTARFEHSGVAIRAGSTRLAIALKSFGRPGMLRALAPVAPLVNANRVTFAHGPVREWWANGPLGLEQGFDVARRPGGTGALTLSLAVSGEARLYHRTVLLAGGLRYTGLRATDARGQSLRAWFQVKDGRVLVRVDDRGARYPVRIDPTVQQAQLSPRGGVAGDQFGYSVATSGSTVVVGVPYHEANSEPYSGAVYVFHVPAAGWKSATQTAELTDSTLGGDEELGFSVAISSDGHTIVAGAPAGSEAPPQEHTNPGNSQGTVDVFTATGNWKSASTPNARLTVSASESPLGGELGWSVGISGTTIVAGAPYDGAAYPYTGLAYVFNEPGGGWSGAQNQTAVLTASPLSTENSGEDLFGWSVGISGNAIVVGAPDYAGVSKDAQGAAYVFTGPWSGTQTQTAELLASNPTSNDQLGISVAVSGNTVVAGAFNHQVGPNPGQGAAYVFTTPWSGTEKQTAELTASDGSSTDELGTSVAISGNTIVAGAPHHQVAGNGDQGAVYAFSKPTAGWKNSTRPTELTAIHGDANDALGDSVAIAGNTIVGGAPRHDAESNTADFGAAYVFGPSATVEKISAAHAGATVAISCPAGSDGCAAVTLKVTVKEHLKDGKIKSITAHRAMETASAKTKVIVIASGTATLAAGAKKTVKLRLNSAGRALLSKFHKLTALVTVSSGGRTIKTAAITLGKPKKK